MASHADSAHDLLDLDIQTLRQYVDLFPHQGLSKVLTGYLNSGISKYPLTPDDLEAPDLSEGGVALNVQFTQEDCLVLMTVGPFQRVAEIQETDHSVGRHTRSEDISTGTLLAWRLLPLIRRV
jgi:hypothetical protein